MTHAALRPLRALALLLPLVACGTTAPHDGAPRSAGAAAEPSAASESFARLDCPRAFELGLAALDEGRLETAIGAFERALELWPQNATVAYNLACAHSLAGAEDVAFTWLGRAADWGFGLGDGNFTLAQTDPDLAALRSDWRFDAFLARMAGTLANVERRTSAPLLALTPTGADPRGVLVVLLDVGHTAKSARVGPWPDVAAELGFALVVAPGSLAVGADEEDGLAWFGEAAAYFEAPARYEDPTVDLVRRVVDENGWRDLPLVLAGEGQGGIVAGHMALRHHTLFDGVVVVEAPLFEPLMRRAHAARSGPVLLSARLVWTAEPTFLVDTDETRASYGETALGLLEELGVDARLELLSVWPTWSDREAVVPELVRAVRGVAAGG
jgi:pimeloyl-ACP methyl ester carboxylesterase